jgi:hypothetical protein
MSDYQTPFIPPLGTPSPDSGVHAPVIPGSSTPSSRSSHSRPNSNSGTPAMLPAGWASSYAGSGGLPFLGAGTPYTQPPFIPFSPFSNSNPPQSVGGAGFTPLPPVGPGGVSIDYRGYPNYLPPSTPIMTTQAQQGLPPVNPPVIPPGTPWHSGVGAVPLHHAPSGGGGLPETPWPGGGHAATFRGGWPAAGGGQYPPMSYPPGGAWGFTSPDPAAYMALAGGGWAGSVGVTQPSQLEPPRKYEKEMGDRMPKWTAGPHCELVLLL